MPSSCARWMGSTPAIRTISPNWRHTATRLPSPPSCVSAPRCVADMAKAVKPGTLCYYGALVNDVYAAPPATIGRANTGRERLHPGDRPEGRPLGVFALTNGEVDLAKVPARKALMRRTEHQNAAE